MGRCGSLWVVLVHYGSFWLNSILVQPFDHEADKYVPPKKKF